MLPIHQHRIQETLHKLGKIQPEDLAPVIAGYYSTLSFSVARQQLQQLANTVSNMAVAINGFIMDEKWKQQEAADTRQQQEATRLAKGLQGEALLSVPEVAERLGLGRQKVYSMITSGNLPAMDINAGTGKKRLLRVKAADLP